MSYQNGIDNAKVASQLPFLVKGGIVNVNDRGQWDDSAPNNWFDYADNAAGTGRVHWLTRVNGSNQTQLFNENGVTAFALQLVQLTAVATPTITNAGTAGVVSYSYEVVARNGFGPTSGTAPASAAGSTSTGNATLSATNYNVITFAKISGAAYYDIYRSASSGTPSTTGLIGTVLATVAPGEGPTGGSQTATYTFNDTGLTGDGTTAPTTNTSGALVAPTVTGGIVVPVIGTPTNLVATTNGTAGSTSNTWKVVAIAQTGTSAASSGVTDTTCNATLTATNSVTITWDLVPGAVSYNIYRTSSGGTPSTTGKIGNSTTTSFTDTGLAGDSTTPPTVNTTGAIGLARINDTNGNPTLIFTATASAVNQVTLADSATGNPPSLTASGSDTNIGLSLLPVGTTNASLVTVGDSGTASATTGAATLSKQRGVITSESLTTAAGATYTLTLTNTKIATTSIVLVNVGYGTSTTGQPTVARVNPASGSATIVIQNIHASAALNGTIQIYFAVLQ